MDGYQWSYLAAAIALGAAALLKTGTYLLLRYFVDDYLIVGGAPFPLPLVAMAFVGVALFEGGFTYVSGRLAARTAEGIALRLRRYLFDHLQRLPFGYYNEAQTGELISRSTSDVDALRRFFSDQAIGVGRITLLFAVNLGALIVLHARLALLSVSV
ncbi:MAG: ABC transporter ATP-binding protein, partial [Anaerolineae bacterium]|nr:ABC transporter ATP-binding protein [Anaerolineae bacterium]